MISKELFCKAIKAIQDDRKQNAELSDALEKHLVDGWVVIKTSASFNMLIELLKDIFQDNDKYPILEWWLFEKVEKKIYDTKGSVIADVTKAEDLYDYLIEIRK